MPNVTCYVAELKVRSDLPLDDDLKVQGRPIAGYFQEASIHGPGNPAIDLRLDYSRRHKLTSQGGSGVNDLQLQEALAQLLQPAGPPGDPAVGLILADFYSGLGEYVYGFMFDLDCHTPAFGPRQGCAVFLEKIHARVDAANTNDQAFRDLVAYTAIHELGHVFNLWHEQGSFMAPSPVENYRQVFEFAEDHKTYLRNASDPANSFYVLPGGSAFNDRGPIGRSGGDKPFYMSAAADGLKLDIGLSHQEFWCFEPVELDVILSVPDPGNGPVMVPDEIDPGYACFEIWITRPDGERHRYRPSKHFCGNPDRRRLSPEEPFTRDISIFRQSGGYTFPMAGKYEIQAVLRLSPDISVFSNTVACEAMLARPGSDTYLSMREAFLSEEAVKLLRYRSRMPFRTDYQRLKRFAESYSSTASAAEVNYSLGRALIRSSGAEADAGRSERLRKQGLLHLENAAKHAQIGPHRRTTAERLLNESEHTGQAR